MFKLEAKMDLYLFDQLVGFWGPAKTTWHDATEKEKEFLNDYVEEFTFKSLGEINDWMWNYVPHLLEEYRERK